MHLSYSSIKFILELWNCWWQLTGTYRVFLGGDGNVLESDSGDDCTNLNILKTTELYISKWPILCYVNFNSRPSISCRLSFLAEASLTHTVVPLASKLFLEPARHPHAPALLHLLLLLPTKLFLLIYSCLISSAFQVFAQMTPSMKPSLGFYF